MIVFMEQRISPEKLVIDGSRAKEPGNIDAAGNIDAEGHLNQRGSSHHIRESVAGQLS